MTDPRLSRGLRPDQTRPTQTTRVQRAGRLRPNQTRPTQAPRVQQVGLMGTLWILLLFTGGVAARTCRFHDVLEHLNLTRDNELFYMTRPVNDHRQATLVSMEMCLYAILDVVEKDQKFISYVWTIMKWQNDFISWNPDDFCGIRNVSIPFEVLWKPDITIEEMVEKDKAPPSLHLYIRSNGEVEVQNDQVLVSTCRMRVHRFPFDTQSCNLSFKSVIHTVNDIQLVASENSKEATEQSKDVMRIQYEWLFIDINVYNTTTEENQDMVVYVVNMSRRSLLYIVNFLLPVLFFLCLDLSSFLISHGGGEKLTFKVTVLLAITVLQLILNEILPASSDRIPLIALYCIGIFALMLLSLLETIVVMYLMKKDEHPPPPRDDEEETAGFAGRTSAGRIYDSSTVEAPAGLMEETHFHQNSTHVSSPGSKPAEENASLEKILDELKLVERSLVRLKGPHEEPGWWTQLAKKINKVFFVVYVAMVGVFLTYTYIEWQKDD
ncbi:5-hydroxytryptamine receptor 3A-like [Boleophthalmus pectinirostris]|uniref:5-hydroxytryptamine receptor 3A-like n=1 Tax=Boleophthalmus pectinirostris TaxID=150288 RepID=UPI0024310A0A|nr:5-hydroxytryptamine receptor 3A-like [Boleophthalmus pectinirostris]